MVNFPRTSIDPQDEVKVVAVLAGRDPVDLVDVKAVRADAKVVRAVLVDRAGVKVVRAEDLGSAAPEVPEVPEDVKVVQADQVAHLLFPQILIACSSMQ